MATIDRTPNGGTAGHPANVARPYVVTSQVHDTADGGTGGDVFGTEGAGSTSCVEDICILYNFIFYSHFFLFSHHLNILLLYHYLNH